MLEKCIELKIPRAKGIPQGSLISVRVGSVRRQALYGSDRPYRFQGNYGKSELMKVDVYVPIAQARLLLDTGLSQTAWSQQLEVPPAFQRDQEAPAALLASALAPASGDMSIDFEFNRQGLEGDEACQGATSSVAAAFGDSFAAEAEERKAPDRPAAVPISETSAAKRHQVAIEAQPYFQQHEVLEVLRELLQVLIKEQPVDPYGFMIKVLENSKNQRAANAALRRPKRPESAPSCGRAQRPQSAARSRTPVEAQPSWAVSDPAAASDKKAVAEALPRPVAKPSVDDVLEAKLRTAFGGATNNGRLGAVLREVSPPSPHLQDVEGKEASEALPRHGAKPSADDALQAKLRATFGGAADSGELSAVLKEVRCPKAQSAAPDQSEALRPALPPPQDPPPPPVDPPMLPPTVGAQADSSKDGPKLSRQEQLEAIQDKLRANLVAKAREGALPQILADCGFGPIPRAASPCGVDSGTSSEAPSAIPTQNSCEVRPSAGAERSTETVVDSAGGDPISSIEAAPESPPPQSKPAPSVDVEVEEIPRDDRAVFQATQDVAKECASNLEALVLPLLEKATTPDTEAQSGKSPELKAQAVEAIREKLLQNILEKHVAGELEVSLQQGAENEAKEPSKAVGVLEVSADVRAIFARYASGDATWSYEDYQRFQSDTRDKDLEVLSKGELDEFLEIIGASKRGLDAAALAGLLAVVQKDAKKLLASLPATPGKAAEALSRDSPKPRVNTGFDLASAKASAPSGGAAAPGATSEDSGMEQFRSRLRDALTHAAKEDSLQSILQEAYNVSGGKPVATLGCTKRAPPATQRIEEATSGTAAASTVEASASTVAAADKPPPLTSTKTPPTVSVDTQRPKMPVVAARYVGPALGPGAASSGAKLGTVVSTPSSPSTSPAGKAVIAQPTVPARQLSSPESQGVIAQPLVQPQPASGQASKAEVMQPAGLAQTLPPPNQADRQAQSDTQLTAKAASATEEFRLQLQEGIIGNLRVVTQPSGSDSAQQAEEIRCQMRQALTEAMRAELAADMDSRTLALAGQTRPQVATDACVVTPTVAESKVVVGNGQRPAEESRKPSWGSEVGRLKDDTQSLKERTAQLEASMAALAQENKEIRQAAGLGEYSFK